MYKNVVLNWLDLLKYCNILMPNVFNFLDACLCLTYTKRTSWQGTVCQWPFYRSLCCNSAVAMGTGYMNTICIITPNPRPPVWY